MDLKEIIELGKQLGLQGVELKEWAEEKVTYEGEEKAREREERAADRVASQEKAEVEERTLQLRIRLAETRATTTAEITTEGSNNGRTNSSHLCLRICIPPYDERRDDLDAYLKRFERIAKGEDWPEPKWATALSMCLTGEALKVYGRLSPRDSMSYEATKRALLDRFQFTTEGYREKFRNSKPEEGETVHRPASRIL
ncbi:unnamed protein product [Ixodes persulcatus]